MLRIDAVRLGLAAGIFAGLWFFVLTLIAAVNGFGLEALTMFKDIFFGYEVSVPGSLVGAIYGFMMGFIQFYFIAFVYNLLGPSDRRP